MATVSVHALSTGSITLPERFFISPADQEAKHTVPSLSFLIQHHSPDGKATRIVFDLGIRRDLSLYPTPLQKHCDGRQPITNDPDAVASLAKGNLSVDDIDYVMFSHVHYDHVGMPRDFTNPKTRFVVGPGAADLLSGKTKLNNGSHSFFEADLLPLDQTIELPTPPTESQSSQPSSLFSDERNLSWQPLSPFPHAIDFFGDASCYVVNAPGHLPGHINLLCRISPSKYVFLAGDTCHDIRLFRGERDIATWQDDTGKHCCIHADIPMAKETISRAKQIHDNGFDAGEGEKAEVEVVFAHNWEWDADAKEKGRFWPGSL